MRTIILIAAALLTGCTSLQYAGTAEYSARPVFSPITGEPVCCEVIVRNGKEFDELDVSVTKQGSDYTVTLRERGVSAFKGQEIAASAVGGSVEAAAGVATTAITAPALGNGIRAILPVIAK